MSSSSSSSSGTITRPQTMSIPTRSRDAQAILPKIPSRLSNIGEKMSQLAEIFRELDQINADDFDMPQDNTIEKNYYRDLSVLFEIMGKNFNALGSNLREPYNTFASNSNLPTAESQTKELRALYKASSTAFKSFFDTGSAEMGEIRLETIDAEQMMEEERLMTICNAFTGIKKEMRTYVSTLNQFKNNLISLRNSYKKKESEEYKFFDGLVAVIVQMYVIYKDLNESLDSVIPDLLDPKLINVADMVSNLDGAVRTFITRFQNVYILFVEGYAIKSVTFKRYSDMRTFDIFDRPFKSPLANIRNLFVHLDNICDYTSGDIRNSAERTLSKVRDCINRVKAAFKYSYRIEKLLDFKKVIDDYNPDDKVIMDGTREVVMSVKSGTFIVEGKLPFSKFECKKPISGKFHVFNNGLLLCSTRSKECTLIDFKDVDVNVDGSSLKLTHESKEWVITVSNLNKSFDKFKDNVVKMVAESKEKRVFGADLVSLAARSKSSTLHIPAIIDEALQYLLQPESLKTEGVMRKSANEKELCRFVQATDNGYRVYFNDPYTASCFLKRWVAFIPGRLLMDSKTNEWKAAGTDINKLVRVFNTLPEPNKAVFRALINLEVKLLAEESSNLMNKDALITCLQMAVLNDQYVANDILSAFLDRPEVLEDVTPRPRRISAVTPMKLTPPNKHLRTPSDPSSYSASGSNSRDAATISRSPSPPSAILGMQSQQIPVPPPQAQVTIQQQQQVPVPPQHQAPVPPLLPQIPIQPQQQTQSPPQQQQQQQQQTQNQTQQQQQHHHPLMALGETKSKHSFLNPFKPNFPPPPPK